MGEHFTFILVEIIRRSVMEYSKGDINLKYKTVSVSHFPDLQEDIEKLDREGKLSNNEVFRIYIRDFKFAIPDDFPEAKSIIVAAVYTPLMVVNVHYNKQVYEILNPPPYVRRPITPEDIEQAFVNHIIQAKGFKLQRTVSVHLKLLAVRSGLAKYGKNNIAYVDGMGSLFSLYSYFTDYEFPQDDWGEIEMMEICKTCEVCLRKCSTGAISQDAFVIDIEKCLSLYNEILGEFPEWIDSEAHNALMGCMHCQLTCPVNREVSKEIYKLDDITEADTNRILTGDIDTEFLEALSEKLGGIYSVSSEKLFPIMQRNLKVLLPIDDKN
jgi:epoxyqueuosine reductase